MDANNEVAFQCMGVVACKEYPDCESIEKARGEIESRDSTIAEVVEFARCYRAQVAALVESLKYLDARLDRIIAHDTKEGKK